MEIGNTKHGGGEVALEPVLEPMTPVAAEPEAPSGDPLALLQKAVRSEAFVPGLIAFVGVVLLFWDMMQFLPRLWMSEDGYYSHGFIVPFISGFIVYKAWPKLKDRPVKPDYWALIPLIGVLFMARVAATTEMYAIASLTLIACILASIWLVAGFQWLKGLFFPTVYLLFALPIWTMAINIYTNPLQIYSTTVSYMLLKLGGFNPYQMDATTIMLGRFDLNVAVPCSGLKLLLALTAFTAFFMLVANLRWWGNLLMVLMVVPLGLLINGLRIALIGVVGHTMGHDAGMAFHDWSGYVTLVICFFILFKIARGLGWKD